jgi:hypothetical protein
MQRDVFICHAREDRAAVAHPLAAALRRHGLDVLIDGQELTPGDGVRARVDEGLARAGWGVLVIGPGFLGMEWPRAELDRLLAREMGPERLIVPLWHGVTAAAVARRSPFLAARLAVDTDQGIDAACEALLALAGRRTPAVGAPEETQRPALAAIWRSLVENPGFSLADLHQHFAHREAYAGQEIGGYTLRGLIGVGASGAVFAAVHARLGRQVALKLFFPFADDLRQVMQSAASRPFAIPGSRRCWITATCASASARRRTWSTSRWTAVRCRSGAAPCRRRATRPAPPVSAPCSLAAWTSPSPRPRRCARHTSAASTARPACRTAT